MKKLLSLTLTLILVLSVVSSCALFKPLGSLTNTESETQTNTQTNTEISTETNTQTNTQTNTSTDTNVGNTLTESWQFNYDYGFHREGLVTLLVESSQLMTGFENVIIPEDIVAGDVMHIEYTGEIHTELSYPGTTSLYNGEVISYSFEYAYIIHYNFSVAYSIETIKNLYEFDDEYVVLDRSGAFVSLDEYEGNEIYLVVDQAKYQFEPGHDPDLDEETPDEIIPIVCMLAYNPRDLEDGQPSEITSKEAFEIASEHFYNNYAEDGVGFEYSLGMGIEDGGNYTVYFKKLYANGTVGNVYYYTIDKITGEILEISIEEESLKNEDVKTSYFMYTYAYWHVFDTLSGKAYANLLCDDSYIHIDIEEPLDITAGDMLIVEHTGYFMTLETYPGSTSLYDGEVISYRYKYSTVFTLLGDEIDSEAIKAKYDFRWGDEYVILNRDGDFVSLDEYEGTTLYLVLDMERAEKIDKNEIQPSWDETKIPIACALAYNPRDIEDGKVEHNISEAEAIQIAMEAHYQRDNFLPKGYEYKPRIIEGNNPTYYYVFFDVEYVGEDDVDPDMLLMDCFTYTCIIDKETGEILKN